jgi:hypothetical protein
MAKRVRMPREQIRRFIMVQIPARQVVAIGNDCGQHDKSQVSKFQRYQIVKGVMHMVLA